jgi:AraC-like DNA-binding protein
MGAASVPGRERGRETERAWRALTAIDRRCGESLVVSDVAIELNVSTRTLQRLLSRAGTDFSTRLQHCRAQRAAALLAQGRPVNEVARSCGFRSPSHFSAVVFPGWFGISPSEFRQLAQLLRRGRFSGVPVTRRAADDDDLVACLREVLDHGGSLADLLHRVLPSARTTAIRAILSSAPILEEPA